MIFFCGGTIINYLHLNLLKLIFFVFAVCCIVSSGVGESVSASQILLSDAPRHQDITRLSLRRPIDFWRNSALFIGAVAHCTMKIG